MALEIRNPMMNAAVRGVTNPQNLSPQRIAQQPDAAPRQGIGEQPLGRGGAPTAAAAAAGEVRVGFGRDTVSIPQLTATTVRQNVENARTLVPTVEEEQARIRERFAELRDQLVPEPQQAPEAQQAAGPEQPVGPDMTAPVAPEDGVLQVEETQAAMGAQPTEFIVDDTIRVPPQPGSPMFLNMLV